VRVKGHRDDRAVRPGELAGGGDQGGVPPVGPVEVADGHDPAAHPIRRNVLEPQRDDGHAGGELVQGGRCPSL
jgi:hypothetical protein